jgi:hypothetical protein
LPCAGVVLLAERPGPVSVDAEGRLYGLFGQAETETDGLSWKEGLTRQLLRQILV